MVCNSEDCAHSVYYHTLSLFQLPLMQQKFHVLAVHPNKYLVDVDDWVKKTVVEKSLESLHKHQQVSKWEYCNDLATDM